MWISKLKFTEFLNFSLMLLFKVASNCGLQVFVVGEQYGYGDTENIPSVML